jgi:hypothetical protein
MCQRAFVSRSFSYEVFFFSVADPGCLSLIPYSNFFHPGFASKIKSIFHLFPSSRKYDPCCPSRIRFLSYPSRIQGSKRHRIRPTLLPIFFHCPGGADCAALVNVRPTIVSKLSEMCIIRVVYPVPSYTSQIPVHATGQKGTGFLYFPIVQAARIVRPL